MPSFRARFVAGAALVPVLVAAPVPARTQSPDALAVAVEAALHGERGLGRLEVAVAGAEVTLTEVKSTASG